MLKDEKTFAKSPAFWTAWQRGEIDSLGTLVSWVTVDTMLVADDANHSRLRSLVSKAFTPGRVGELRERIVAITGELLDDVQRVGAAGQPVDLKERFALRLPLTVISEMFGVPEAERDTVHALCAPAFDQSITPEQALANHSALQLFLEELIAAKREQPEEDLTSALIAARDNDDRLTSSEMVWMLALMLGAGFETTVNLISSATGLLLDNPGQLDLIREGRFGWQHAIDETLRLQPPIGALPFRYTRRPASIGGVQIPAGVPVLPHFAAAGRDPSVHGRDVDRFKITRTNSQVAAFSYGPHHCLGANLARLEAEIALAAVFERFPSLRLAAGYDTLPSVPSIVARGKTKLPVLTTSTQGQP